MTDLTTATEAIGELADALGVELPADPSVFRMIGPLRQYAVHQDTVLDRNHPLTLAVASALDRLAAVGRRGDAYYGAAFDRDLDAALARVVATARRWVAARAEVSAGRRIIP